MLCVFMLPLQVIDFNREVYMDKTTIEMMYSVNVLIKFNNNLPDLLELFPESEKDVDLLMPYVDYEIKKILKDIIHIEKL